MKIRGKKIKPKKKADRAIKIKKLKPYERIAHDVLKNAHRKLSTNEVAEHANMSWSTAKKNLKELRKKRRGVHSEKKGKSILWFIKR